MDNEREKLKVLINYLDSEYSQKIRNYSDDEQHKLNAERWGNYNRMVCDSNIEGIYDYITWITRQIG